MGAKGGQAETNSNPKERIQNMGYQKLTNLLE